MHVLLLADTHVPTRARDLPAAVWAAVDDADVVIHAGDWMSPDLLDALQGRSAELIACWGNNDGPELRSRLPETARTTIGGVRVAVTHESGAKTGREKRMQAAFPDVDLLVFGHSHIPWDSLCDNGLRLLNPGSPTDRRRQPYCTYMTLTLSDGIIGDLELVHV